MLRVVNKVYFTSPG